MRTNRTTLSHWLLVLVLIIATASATPFARAVVLGTSVTQSAPPPKGMERVTSVEGITEYRMANGLHVLLFPDPTKPTVTVNLTYLVGSRNENYGETGMAHLLEHLMFKGSTNHHDINKEMTDHGARNNASTSFDRTNYFETMAATDENLKWALEFEADRMLNSFIAKKDLDSEMTVVRNEYESGENSPVNIMIERSLSTAYLWHNYGKSTIGARSDIENVPIDRLQAFYHFYYQPDNCVLLVAGKFDEAKTLNLINTIYSALPRPSRVIQKTYTTEPTQDGERSVALRRVGDVQAVSAVYHVPAGAHPDFAALAILSRVLAAVPTGRLHKALVETKKASSVFGFNFQLREPGVAFFGAQVRQEGSLDEARAELLKTIEGVAANAPSKEEIDRARTELLKNIELNLNDSERVGLNLSEWLAQGDWRLFFLHRDRLRKVTPEDVARVAGQYFKPSNRTLGLFYPTPKPERAEIPQTSQDDIAAMLKDYKGDAAVATGEAFDPSPENIESRTLRSAAPNGLKLALLPKKTRGASVVATITLRFGDEKSLMNRSTAASMAGSMLMRGTTKHTREQLKDEFDRLKARVNVGGGATQAIAAIETNRENLPAVMKLVAEVLREPAFPEKEFDLLKTERLAGIEQQRSEPVNVAFTAFGRQLNPYPKGDVRYTPAIEEEIENTKAATLDDARKFYADFYGASNSYVSVVGDFDDKDIGALAKELFGNWKSPRPFERVASVYHDVAPTVKSFNTPDKANAFFVAGMNLTVRDDDPDYPALVLGNFILGGGAGNNRLWTRIREKEGLSYGVGSSISASPLDKFGSFSANAIYAPQNVQKLETAFKEEIARALKDGFTADEITTGKAGLFQSRKINRAQDAGLARQLATYLYLNRTLNWDAEFEKKIAALTADQVSDAMRRRIDPAKITIVKAGDFDKNPPAK